MRRIKSKMDRDGRKVDMGEGQRVSWKRKLSLEDQLVVWPLKGEAHFPHCSGKRKGSLSRDRK